VCKYITDINLSSGVLSQTPQPDNSVT